jgi:hypothetical protein
MWDLRHWGRLCPSTSVFLACSYLTEYCIVTGTCDSIVAMALRCKLEGRGFENRWGEWSLSIHLILSAALGPGLHSACNRNEYQKHNTYFTGSRVWPVREADKLTPIFEPIIKLVWDPWPLTVMTTLFIHTLPSWYNRPNVSRRDTAWNHLRNEKKPKWIYIC